MTHQDLAVIVHQFYKGPDGFFPFDDGSKTGICWGIRRVAGIDIIVFRGSVTFKDWMHDFDAFAQPCDGGPLGPVHHGFHDGLPTIWPLIKQHTGPSRIFCGHSLGAARASIMAAIATLDGQPPLARVVWGEPKPGFRKLADILKAVPGASYRTHDAKGSGHDLVTEVPLTFFPEAYRHGSDMIDVPVTPASNDWGPFRYHHMELYAPATPQTAIALAATA